MGSKKKLLVGFVCHLLIIQGLNAQTKRIANLKLVVASAKTAEAKIAALLNLCNERNSLKTVSLLEYAQSARDLALKIGDEKAVIASDFYTASGVMRNTLYDSAISICDRNIALLALKAGNSKWLLEYNNLKAQTLIRSSKFKEALSILYELLHQSDIENDTTMQVKVKCNIGWLHMEMTQYKEGISWFYKAFATTKNASIFLNYPPAFTTLASCYNNISNYDSALFYVNKGIESATAAEQLSFLANGLNIRADVYLNTNKNDLAEADLTRALEIRKQVGDPFYIVSDITQIGFFYAVTGNYNQGIAIVKQGLDTAAKYHLTAKLGLLYNALAENYKRSGNYKNYGLALEEIIKLKDSLYEINSADALAGLQARYNVQKTENIIIQQKLDIVSKDYLYYTTIILFLFVSVIIFILYKNYRKKEKQKMEQMVEQQLLNEKIAVIKAEEKERKRIAADLHDNLGAYAAAISSNVRSVKKENVFNQDLTLRLEENAQDMVNELSNTIWVLKKETQQLTEISDRLKVWLQKLIYNYPGVNYDFDEQIEEDIVLSPSHALQLYHILQECINNALRHSHCTQLTIYFNSHKDGWQIKVADNGTGFKVNDLVKGNGIINIEERAMACGWKVNWKQENGTVVTLEA